MKEINFENERQKNGIKMGILYPYRGKALYSGKWVYGYLLCTSNCNTAYIMTPIGKSAKDNQFTFEFVDLSSVGRFISLQDKNKRALYEGDIVKGFDLQFQVSFKGVIKFGGGSFYIDGLDGTTHYRWMDYEVECIGNIYDNPELLEAEE